jgi:hypothetical protein
MQTGDPMPITVSITFRNDNQNTIWNRLTARLGREPTNSEVKEDVWRILREAREEIRNA